MTWDEDLERRLVALANGPLSMKQIGLALGVSRSTIAGKIRRFKRRGLIAEGPRKVNAGGRPRKENPKRKRSPRPKQMPVERDRTLRDYPNRAVEAPVERQAAPAPGRSSGTSVRFDPRPAPSMKMRRLLFAELKYGDGKCRFPLGDVGDPDFCFCGNEALTGRSYCAPHHAHAHQRVG